MVKKGAFLMAGGAKDREDREVYSAPWIGGGERSEPSPECLSGHMTQTANPVTLLASPLGEEGHKVAKGVQANWIHRGAPRPANPVRRHPAKSVWTVVILIMILDVDVTVAGGIIKRIAP